MDLKLMIFVCVLTHVVYCEKPNIILLFADDVSGEMFVVVVYMYKFMWLVTLISYEMFW